MMGIGFGMPEDQSDEAELSRRAASGDSAAMAALFSRYRTKLKVMVRLRLDRRLQGRVDPSDILQETYLDASQRMAQYANQPGLPFFLWLRFLTAQRMLITYRQHLGTKMRDANVEVSMFRGGMKAVATSIAEELLAGLSSPDQAAIRHEQRLQLQDALNRMDETDREVLVLRHFEELSNHQVAQVLELSKTAASNRYVRALKRLREILRDIGIGQL